MLAVQVVVDVIHAAALVTVDVIVVANPACRVLELAVQVVADAICAAVPVAVDVVDVLDAETAWK